MGEGGGRSRRGYAYQDDEATESDSDSDEDTEDEAQREREEAIVQQALSRIRKAQAKGKQQVKLNKEELAALERRKQRLAAEATRKASGASGSGSDRKRRKEKEDRVTVPLSHFDAPPAPSRRGKAVGGPDDSLPMHPTPSTLTVVNEARRPPVGALAPPATSSRSSPRSGTGSSHRPRSQAGGRSSPFEYQYVNAPPNLRHTSDPTAKPLSRTSYQYEDDYRRRSGSSQSLQQPDPFQYQTAGPRVSHRSSALADANDMAISADVDLAYGVLPPDNPRRSTRISGRFPSDDEETTSDEIGNGARISRDNSNENMPGMEHRRSTSPEPERASKSKKSSPPPKRRPVGGSSGKKSRKSK
ncbi:heat shock transcription factor eukaryote [Microdochium nivale]|nr:heat shock transcription factor eukaryote [Microdochium nivale]